jgi:hypothetical protein
MSQPWNFLPGKMPRKNVPVLVVKEDGEKSFVREAVYTGDGYWKGFGNAPVRAWQPLPHTPISIALKKVLDERDKILDTLFLKKTRGSTKVQHKRLLELDAKIEKAQRARETEFERFVHATFDALKSGTQEITQ